MYSGEREFQVMTEELATLHDQINITSNYARELSILLTNSVFKEQNNDIRSSLEMIKNIESDIENIRKKITRNVVGIEYLMSYKKDVYRIVYIIDKFTGYFSGIVYRLSNIKISILKQAKCDNDIITLIEKVIESICKLNEMARALSINHRNIDLTHEIQKLKGEVDSTYRNILIKTFDGTENTKELILFKDTVKAIEEMADNCQETSDSFTILALSL